MDAIRKDIVQEMGRSRLEKSHVYDVLLRIIDQVETIQGVQLPFIDAEMMPETPPSTPEAVPEPVVEATPEPVAEEPVVEIEEPVVEAEEPVVEAEEPVVEAEEPVIETEEPVVEEPIKKSSKNKKR